MQALALCLFVDVGSGKGRLKPLQRVRDSRILLTYIAWLVRESGHVWAETFAAQFLLCCFS